jgi:hypothetical protein
MWIVFSGKWVLELLKGSKAERRQDAAKAGRNGGRRIGKLAGAAG